MIYVQIVEPLEIQPVGAGLAPARELTASELPALLEQTAAAALQRVEPDQPVELTLVVADDRRLQDLNLQFLGVDAPTDVLSFPVGDTDPDSGFLYLGDVLISYPRAAAQASAAGHSLQAELQLLVVHGVLHLCGYDHADPAGKASMWALQADILDTLGCEITGPVEQA